MLNLKFMMIIGFETFENRHVATRLLVPLSAKLSQQPENGNWRNNLMCPPKGTLLRLMYTPYCPLAVSNMQNGCSMVKRNRSCRFRMDLRSWSSRHNNLPIQEHYFCFIVFNG